MADKKTITLTKGLIKLPDGTYIAPYTDTKGAFEIGDIGQALFINETEGLRRRLNGQTIAINAHTQPLLDKLKSIRQLYPQLFCTEDRWQQIAKSNYLGQVGKFVIEEEPKQYNYHYNVTKSGDVIIDDNGIAYNFINNTNSLYLPQPLPYATANTIEAVFKINATDGTFTPIMGNTTDAPAGGGIVLRSDTTNRLYLWGTTNSTAWTTSKFDTGIDIIVGQDCYIKFTYDGTNYQVHVSSDNITWTSGTLLTSARFTNPTPTWLFCTGSNNAYNLKGTADLKECYIKVNGDLWWQGATLADELDLPPYIRLPRIIETQGAPTYEKLGELTTSVNRRLIACKKPTFEDTYWYNLYSDGWCEQGARILQNGATNAAWTTYTITLRIPYVDDLYNVFSMTSHGAETSAPSVWAVTPNTFVTRPYNDQGDAQWSTRGWTNAHLSYSENITYDGEPQYPYFIQISQGQTTQTHIRNDWTISEPYTIFEPKYSYNQLNNASWLLSNQQWNDSKIYPFAYEALCIELNDTIQTGEKVQLPSGGYYTKHLQTLVYDPSRFTLVGLPKISKKGFAHTLSSTNYVKFNVGNAMQQAESYALKFRMQYINDTVLLSTHNQDTINNSNGWLIRLYDNKLYTSFAMVEGIWAHESTPSEMDFVEGDYYYVKLSYTNSYGYKLEVSKDDIKYDVAWEYTDVNRFSPVSNEFYFGYDYENVNAIGTPIDLKTIHFKYKDDTEHLISGAYYVPMVYDINDINKLNADYERKFKVDRLNETFMLPTEVDRELNNGEMLYYYIGDILQNTALIDIGRMTEALARKIDTDRFDRAYYFRKCPKVTLTQDQSVTYEFSMVSKGRPIFINFNGDQNVTTSTGWARIYMYRNGVQIATQTIVGCSASENNVFAMSYLDTNVYYGESITYKITITQHSGTAEYSEEANGLNRIIAYEI